MTKHPSPRKVQIAPPQSILLSESELALMRPYLERAASAARAIQSAQESLDAIAKTISGRAGAREGQRFSLDLTGKRLIPIP